MKPKSDWRKKKIRYKSLWHHCWYIMRWLVYFWNCWSPLLDLQQQQEGAGIWGFSGHTGTSTGQLKTGKISPALTDLDVCWCVKMVCIYPSSVLSRVKGGALLVWVQFWLKYTNQLWSKWVSTWVLLLTNWRSLYSLNLQSPNVHFQHD